MNLRPVTHRSRTRHCDLNMEQRRTVVTVEQQKKKKERMNLLLTFIEAAVPAQFTLLADLSLSY